MPLRYPCGGFPELPEAKYTRLCVCPSGDWAAHHPDHLTELAQRMKDSVQKRKTRSQRRRAARHSGQDPAVPMPSGYVYFGQFIDHDVTRDTQSYKDAKADLSETFNHRTPFADLDLLYGKDPATVPCIYEADGERLKLGWTLPFTRPGGSIIASSQDDLPRAPDGTAVVIDPRSDENLLIAQVHVLFAKFHNRVLQLLRANPALSAGPNGASLLAQARRFVTWHYQWILTHEFLPLIMRLDVLDTIKNKPPRLFPRWFTPQDPLMDMPIEFTVAAFRFGHSMVNTSYFINDEIGVQKSSEIITMTKNGGGIESQLPANWVVGWNDHFFSGLAGQINRGEELDTFIAETLYDLPQSTVHTFRLQLAALKKPLNVQINLNQIMHPPLPEMTLQRGSNMHLPSGQEFANAFGIQPVVPPGQMGGTPEDQEFLKLTGMDQRTPLWYYLLREAEIEPNNEPGIGPNAPLAKLGTLGSTIVGEVLYQLLRNDSESIFNAGQNWSPPKLIFGSSSRVRTLSTMPALVEFAESTGSFPAVP